MLIVSDVIMFDVIIHDVIIIVPMEQLIDAHTVIPTLKGIKYTSLDLSQFSKCLTHCGGKMQMFYGCDEVCVCMLYNILVIGYHSNCLVHYLWVGRLPWKVCISVAMVTME